MCSVDLLITINYIFKLFRLLARIRLSSYQILLNDEGFFIPYPNFLNSIGWTIKISTYFWRQFNEIQKNNDIVQILRI